MLNLLNWFQRLLTPIQKNKIDVYFLPRVMISVLPAERLGAKSAISADV